jgi:hypothetical protein
VRGWAFSGCGETCDDVGGIGVSGDVEIFDVGFGATNSLRRAGMVKTSVSGKRCKSREKCSNGKMGLTSVENFDKSEVTLPSVIRK